MVPPSLVFDMFFDLFCGEHRFAGNKFLVDQWGQVEFGIRRRGLLRFLLALFLPGGPQC